MVSRAVARDAAVVALLRAAVVVRVASENGWLTKSQSRIKIKPGNLAARGVRLFGMTAKGWV